jgi:hypothetical protein
MNLNATTRGNILVCDSLRKTQKIDYLFVRTVLFMIDAESHTYSI